MRHALKLAIGTYLCYISLIVLIPICISGPVLVRSECSDVNLSSSHENSLGGMTSPDSSVLSHVDKNGDKIHDDLASKMLQYEPDEYLEVVVSFEQQPTLMEIASIEAVGATILEVYSIIPACRVRIPRNAIQELTNIQTVHIVEGLSQCKPLLIESTRQLRERPFVWDRGYQGDPNTAVAIIDTGIDASHPDLAGKLVYWQDFSTDASPTPIDFVEHGTHCASIATGTGAHSTGPYFQETYGNYTLDPIGSRSYYPTKIYSTGNLTLDITWDDSIVGEIPYIKLGVRNASVVQISTNFSTSPYSWTSTTPLFPGNYDLIVENNRSAGSRNYVISAKIPAGNTGDSYPEHLRGAAPGSKVVALKVFSNAGSGSLPELLSALDWVHNNYRNYNITTVSMSLGFTGIVTTLDSAVNNLVQQDGVIVVVAAGNYFEYGIEVGSPGTASACITVGAVNKADQITTYSSNGDWGSNPAGKPDIVATGGTVSSSGLTPYNKIRAADSSYSDMAGIDYETSELLRQPDPYFGGYQQMAGTSMACPHVAGIVQLLIDAWPGGWKWDPSDALKIKQILCMSGVEVNSGETPSQVPALNRGTKDLKEGWGRVNVDAALNLTIDDLEFFNPYVITFGNRPMDLKNFGGRVYLESGKRYNFTLFVPSGCDADLYLWELDPTSIGDPILLNKSTSAILGQKEQMIVTAAVTGYYFLTAKFVSGPLQSVASLYLDKIQQLGITIQDPCLGLIISETSGMWFNISVNNPSGPYTTWYSLDGGDNVPFVNCAWIEPCRGIHSVIFYAKDYKGEVASDPILFGVRSTHPENHITLTITQPSNGEALIDVKNIDLRVVFTTDVGTLDSCWYILDYKAPIVFNGNILLNIIPGAHRIVVYANNTLGEEISSQIIKFSIAESPNLDPLAYIILALVGIAIGAIVIGIHSLLSRTPRPSKRSTPSMPSSPTDQPEQKFSFSKAGLLASNPTSPSKTTSDSTSTLNRLLNLTSPQTQGSSIDNAPVTLGAKTPSTTPIPGIMICPQCGATNPKGIKACPYCRWMFL